MSAPSRPSLTPQTALWLLLGGVTLLHLLVMGRFELTEDAAHYALYGLKPALSYFDHPPMIGWMQALVVPLSQSEFALRLWPVILSVAAGLVLYRLANTLFSERAPWVGVVAVAVMQSGIMFNLMGMSMLPDDPLLVFFLASGLFLYRAVVGGDLRAWLWVGICFGLAGLSKYTAVTLVVSALWLLFSERAWRQLATPWPWLGVAVAAVLISPVLIWNAQHDWMSIAYQLGHGLPERHWSFARFGLALAAQVVAYAPGMFLFGLLALIAAFRNWRDPAQRFVVILALPVFLLIGWGAGLKTSLPHWTAVGWAALSVLIAYWLMGAWRARPVRIFTWVSVLYSVAVLGVLYSALVVPWLPYKENHYPLADITGWRAAAQRAAALRETMSATPGPAPVLFVPNWSLASHLAWYARPLTVQDVTPRRDQISLWFGQPQPGARGILVVPHDFHTRPDKMGLNRFARCEPAGSLPIEVGGRTATTYWFYRCEGYGGGA
ncbi:MAG: glycosyltransferase family 39 protein [Gammaproteobacteria bacterium]